MGTLAKNAGRSRSSASSSTPTPATAGGLKSVRPPREHSLCSTNEHAIGAGRNVASGLTARFYAATARLLFQDPVEEGVRYYRKHGFSHINHTVIIQDRILQKHPWVAVSLFKAFAEAKQECYAKVDRLLRSSLVSALAHLEAQRRIFGDDPYPYGLRGNQTALQTLADYAFEQGLTEKRVAIEETFAETTRDL